MVCYFAAARHERLAMIVIIITVSLLDNNIFFIIILIIMISYTIPQPHRPHYMTDTHFLDRGSMKGKIDPGEI